MFIEDIRNDFYNVLLGNRVLLLVHYDVDAICACKILQGLFKCDNISYTLVPVGGISELKTAYEENNEEIKYVVLVNCGGTIDLVDILQPEEEVVFFVLDSHKPTDVCNVYSDGQVRLVYKDSDEKIPNFEDIFKDEDDEEKEEEAGGGREALEALVERRRERRAWEERRHTLLFNYTQFSYYGKPVSCIALEVCVMASRVSTGALWACAVGVTAGAALSARERAAALLDADALQRLAARGPGAPVALQQDAWLPLYREWSLEAALRHSPTLGAALRPYSRAGDAKLRRLLADMGYPLQQARQAFRSMDVELRRGLVGALEAAAARLALPAPTRAAFLLRRPHHRDLAALDLVYVCMALIEQEGVPRAEGFQQALAALGAESGVCGARAAGGARARAALQAAARVAHAALGSRQLHRAGPFTYLIVPEGSADAAAVRGPLWLGVAARWASAAAGGSKPLVASASTDDQNCLLIGIPPKFEEDPRNLFGAAFQQAAAKCGCDVSREYVDSAVVALPTRQRPQLLDALTALLA